VTYKQKQEATASLRSLLYASLRSLSN